MQSFKARCKQINYIRKHQRLMARESQQNELSWYLILHSWRFSWWKITLNNIDFNHVSYHF